MDCHRRGPHSVGGVLLYTGSSSQSRMKLQPYSHWSWRNESGRLVVFSHECFLIITLYCGAETQWFEVPPPLTHHPEPVAGNSKPYLPTNHPAAAELKWITDYIKGGIKAAEGERWAPLSTCTVLDTVNHLLSLSLASIRLYKTVGLLNVSELGSLCYHSMAQMMMATCLHFTIF